MVRAARLLALVAFLASMVTLAVGSPGGSPYCRLSGLPYGLQRGIPSPRGGFTSRSRHRPTGRPRNINRVCIRIASRLTVSSRLTRGRLAWPRKPWVFGGGVCTPLVVTHAYIFFSGRSRKPRDFPSAPTGMLPYHDWLAPAVLGFGGGLDARSSSTRLRSTSELLRTL